MSLGSNPASYLLGAFLLVDGYDNRGLAIFLRWRRTFIKVVLPCPLC